MNATTRKQIAALKAEHDRAAADRIEAELDSFAGTCTDERLAQARRRVEEAHTALLDFCRPLRIQPFPR